MKKEWDDYVVLCLRLSKIEQFEGFPLDFEFLWVCPDRRRDKDNITAGGRKFIFDAVTRLGLWPNDGWKHVGVWDDQWGLSKRNPHIKVTFIETAKEST